MPVAHEGFMPSHRAAPAVRHCPLCGIAMQGSKSREELSKFDSFQCLTCHTTIVEAAPTAGGGEPPRDRSRR